MKKQAWQRKQEDAPRKEEKIQYLKRVQADHEEDKYLEDELKYFNEENKDAPIE